MSTLSLKSNPAVSKKLEGYPKQVQKKLNQLRKLIIETAKKSKDVTELEETLKWGEPSYLAKKGSTIRIDWKSKKPDQYAMYFKCTSKLVLTFKEVYGDLFNYETTRAILFKFDDVIPKKELAQCIDMALNYHRLKHLEFLGANSAE